jgi:hypothetical protein
VSGLPVEIEFPDPRRRRYRSQMAAVVFEQVVSAVSDLPRIPARGPNAQYVPRVRAVDVSGLRAATAAVDTACVRVSA